MCPGIKKKKTRTDLRGETGGERGINLLPYIMSYIKKTH